MKPNILNLITAIVGAVLASLSCHASTTEASGTGDFWKKAPSEVAERYEEASSRFNEDWVLEFADTLAGLAESTKEKGYLYYASELRCHHAFNELDSLEFFKNSDKCLSLAKRLDYEDLYYAEMMNRAGFLINAKDIHKALMVSQQIISEASHGDVKGGLYYGYYSLGTIFSMIGDYNRADDSYKNAIDNVSGKEESKKVNRAQVYDMMAFNMLEAGNYDKALEYAELSLNESPTECDIPACLALASYHLGKYEDFRHYLSEYFGMENNNSAAATYYSTWLSLLENALDGEFDEATEIAENFEDDSEKYAALTEICKLEGDWKHAYEYQAAATKARKESIDNTYGEEITAMDKELNTALQLKERDSQIMKMRILIIMSVLIVIIIAIFSSVTVIRKKESLRIRERELRMGEYYGTLIENAPFGSSKGGLIFDENGRVADYVTLEANKTLRKAFDNRGFTFGVKTIRESYPESGKGIIYGG